MYALPSIASRSCLLCIRTPLLAGLGPAARSSRGRARATLHPFDFALPRRPEDSDFLRTFI